MEWKDCTEEIAKSLNSWLTSETVKKYAMFDSTFKDEFEYYQTNTYEGKIKDVIKVIIHNGIKLGYIVLNYYFYDNIKEVGINPIIVNPDYQNQGYGKRILSHLITHIETLVDGHVDQIYAAIEKNNISSVKLFERVGFIKKEEDDSFYRYYFNRIP